MPPSRQRTSYDRLPQSPQDVPVVDNIQEGTYDSGAQIPVIQDAVALDERIRWIHFLLGAAVLLPWNGTLLSLNLVMHADNQLSFNNRNPIFSVPLVRVSFEEFFQFLHVHYLHCCKLPFPRPCNYFF